MLTNDVVHHTSPPARRLWCAVETSSRRDAEGMNVEQVPLIPFW